MKAPPPFAVVCDELDRRRRVTLGLERVERLLSLLGNPHRSLRIAQVVGTNGKGTTSVALAAALSAAGEPAGAYLSPHVLSYTERVMIGGRFLSEGRFAAAMWEAIRASDGNRVDASQFELLTAGAIKALADEGLSWAVLEAGLGARHDATTAARPEAVVLTNVGLDHADYLGDTVEDISREKLASLSPGATLVLGTDDPAVKRIAQYRCAEVEARLVEASSEAPAGLSEGIPPFKASDAWLGVRAAEELLCRRLTDDGRTGVLKGSAESLPGRFEVREVDGTPVVVDGGHNPAGVLAALEAMHTAYGETPLAVVFGVLRDKDAGSMLTTLRQEARMVVVTRPEGERAADPVRVARADGKPEDGGGSGALVIEDPIEAVRVAVREAGETGGAVLVLGSFQTAAPVLRWLRDA